MRQDLLPRLGSGSLSWMTRLAERLAQLLGRVEILARGADDLRRAASDAYLYEISACISEEPEAFPCDDIPGTHRDPMEVLLHPHQGLLHIIRMPV